MIAQLKRRGVLVRHAPARMGSGKQSNRFSVQKNPSMIGVLMSAQQIPDPHGYDHIDDDQDQKEDQHPAGSQKGRL